MGDGRSVSKNSTAWNRPGQFMMCRESNAQHRIVACFDSPSKRHSREKPVHGCIFRIDLEGRSSAGSSYAVFKCWLVSKDEASTHPGHQFEAWGRLTTPGSKDGKEDLATRRSCVLQQGMKDMASLNLARDEIHRTCKCQDFQKLQGWLSGALSGCKLGA